MSHTPTKQIQNRSVLAEVLLCTWAFVFLTAVLCLNLQYTYVADGNVQPATHSNSGH